MTPEALVSAMALFDRWALTLRCLSGQPPPPLPTTPGRVNRLPEPSSVEADAARIDAEQRAAQVWRALADSEGGDVD